MALARTLRVAALMAAILALAVPAAASASIDVDHEQTIVSEWISDGVIAPGDEIRITEMVRNNGTQPISGLTGILTSPTPGVSILTGSLPFPTVNPDQVAGNITPFRALLPETLTCGANANFSLGLAAGGSATQVTFTVGTGVPGAPQVNEAIDVPKDVADAAGVESLVQVTTVGRVKDIRVRVGQLDHLSVGDLKLVLTGPDGTEVTLFNGQGGSGDNLLDTVFDPDAPTTLAASSAPFSGLHRPVGDLTSFFGKEQEGLWRLKVTDQQGSTGAPVGRLHGWALEINQATCNPTSYADIRATPNPVEPVTEQVTLDASGSYTPTGTIDKFEWDLDNDGIYEVNTGTTPSYTPPPWATSGRRTVRVRVSAGPVTIGTAQATVIVTHRPVADVALVAPLGDILSGDPVTLSAAGSTDQDGAIVRYEWDLDGNGTFEAETDNNPQIVFSFATSGWHLVRVRVTDDDGARGVDFLNIKVKNRPPVAALAVDPNPGIVNQELTLNAGGSFDPDGSVEKYEWDVDLDGTYDYTTSTPTLPFTFGSTGSKTVRVRVTDNLDEISEELTDTEDLTFVVTHAPVVSLAATPLSTRPGTQVNFTATASDADGPIVKYEWDLDGNGTYETDTGTTPTASKTYSQFGNVVVKVRVTDADGAPATDQKTVSMVNASPTAAFTMTPNPVLLGVPVAMDGAASFDPDGTVVRYQWDLDGNGTYETDTAGSPVVSRAYPNALQLIVRLKVTDQDGGTATKAQALTVQSPTSGGGGGGGTGDGGGTSSGGGTGDGLTPTGGNSGGATTDPNAGSGTRPGAGGGGGGAIGAWKASLLGAPIQAMKLALKKGITLTCRASRAATCTLTATIQASDARRLRLATKGSKKPVVIGRATVTTRAGSDARVVLKLGRKVAAKLRKARKVTVVVAGSAKAADGTLRLSRAVLLRR